ncbi:hypothetical protein [Edwardsiella piscicida]|uniref:hypothetical protein n=1 Tax=Edwardsiella piscicida TaxID=1263550 RepID=UPI0035DC7933
MFNFNKSDINALSLIIVPLILSALGAWINPAIIGPASIGTAFSIFTPTVSSANRPG